jgi:hypothetical protein
MTPSTTSADYDRVSQRRHYFVPQFVRSLGLIAAWGWTILAGIGGLGLIITSGPWPPTNGWFALFSGLSACPLTAWLLKKCASIDVPSWARFVAAVLFFVAGRLALRIEGRGTFLPDFSH